MTRKHFVALALALAEQKPGDNWASADKMTQWELDCKAVALVCERVNPNFSRRTFLAACGVEGLA